jgi:heat shock protein beta
MKGSTILLLLGLFAACQVQVALCDAEVNTADFTEEQRAQLSNKAEKHEFQAEVSRLMDIIINSLYANKEVFLRELISNAADALEKARHMTFMKEDYLGDKTDLEIRVWFDDDAKTLVISDTGVGMTKGEMITNLGTVANSGTTRFLESKVDGTADSNLIGQFGVGFYSAFLVADKISFASKSNDDPIQHVWESNAALSFTVSEDPRGNTLGRGSAVTLHLKDDAQEFLNIDKLKELVKRYSQFTQFPIKIRVKKEVDDDTDEDVEEKDEKDEDDVDVSDEDDEKKSKSDKPKRKKTVYEWDQINTQKPIWLRPRNEISDEEYTEFYKSISKDYVDPLARNHFVAEGETEFKSILFIPKKAPSDMLDNYWTKKSEVKLYVRRVLVADKFEDFLPRYLNFVKGIIDSDDLPLNVSREQLQQNKVLKVIGKKIVRKILEMIKNLAAEDVKKLDDKKDDEEDEDEDNTASAKKKVEGEETDWVKFYKEFGKNMKMGCYEDDSNRSKIAKLLRFASVKSPHDEVISLDNYIASVPEGQDNIYYMSGDNVDVMLKNPSLQIFKKKGIDVLLLTDHLDEPCIQRLADYESKKFISIQKADVKLEETDKEKKHFDKVKKLYKPLTDWWKEKLQHETDKGTLKSTGVKVEAVTISKRLVDAPCVVVTSQFGYSAQQEKLMRAQAFQNKDQLGMLSGRKTLEINPNHPVIVDLLSKIKADKEDAKAFDTAVVLFQTALLDSGYEMTDPSLLVQRVYRLMSSSLGVDPDAPIKEVEVPEDEEEPVSKKEEEEDEEEEEEEKVDEEL